MLASLVPRWFYLSPTGSVAGDLVVGTILVCGLALAWVVKQED